jgi:hypothetical protein
MRKPSDTTNRARVLNILGFIFNARCSRNPHIMGNPQAYHNQGNLTLNLVPFISFDQSLDIIETLEVLLLYPSLDNRLSQCSQ